MALDGLFQPWWGYRDGTTPLGLGIHRDTIPRVGTTLGWKMKSRWDFQRAMHAMASASSAMLGGTWMSRFATESLPEIRQGRIIRRAPQIGFELFELVFRHGISQ